MTRKTDTSSSPAKGVRAQTARFPEILIVMNEYRLDPNVLPFDRVKGVGFEMVPAEVLQAEADAARDRAFQEARASGIELLPRPLVGKPYEFTLTVADGEIVRSDALKGKVVLIDCWASWNGSCTEKLPRLKTLYDRRRGDGFEVIGLNFDQARAHGERLVKALALPWPQVYVPGDDRTRRLWREGPDFPSYPKLLLIDRQGVLRWDGGNAYEARRANQRPPRCAATRESSKLSHGIPVLGKPEILARLVLVESLHLQRREPDPALAVRTTTEEASAVPPGADQGFIDPLRIPMQFELEIDPLHLVATTLMRAGRFVVMDVRRRHGVKSTFAVEAIQGFPISRRDCRNLQHVDSVTFYLGDGEDSPDPLSL